MHITATMAQVPNDEQTREGLIRVRDMSPLLKERADACRAAAAKLLSEAEGIDMILRGIAAVEGGGPAASTTTPQQPNGNGHGSENGGLRGIAAVREIMKDGGIWKARDVHNEVERRGWVS